MPAQIVVAADVLAVDEGLRRRLDAVPGLERLGFLARGKPPVIDLKAVADAVLYMTGLPLEANVPFMTVMATAMPLYGRG